MKVENKSPFAAFLLSLLPGFGHLYIGRVFRFIIYAGGFFIPLGILMLVIISGGYIDGAAVFLALGCAAFFFTINMLDMIITIAGGKHRAFANTNGTMERDEYGNIRYVHDPLAVQEQQEKSKVMLMSLIPGLGHMYMGLMVRGITIMVMFAGVFAVGLFLATLLTPVMLILWIALPIIWIYNMFDAISLLTSRQKGEEVEDKSLFSNMEGFLANGKKSRVTAILLSLFPGAGHLYLGMQQRGLQLMGAFLLSIFIVDELHLSLFYLLLPMLWCYTFFDIIAQLRKWENNELKDEPFASVLIPYQRWIGIGLLVVGLYYLLDRIAIKLIDAYLPELIAQYNEFKYMLPTIIISFVLILLGIKLLFGTSRNTSPSDEEGV